MISQSSIIQKRHILLLPFLIQAMALLIKVSLQQICTFWMMDNSSYKPTFLSYSQKIKYVKYRVSLNCYWISEISYMSDNTCPFLFFFNLWLTNRYYDIYPHQVYFYPVIDLWHLPVIEAPHLFDWNHATTAQFFRFKGWPFLFLLLIFGL